MNAARENAVRTVTGHRVAEHRRLTSLDEFLQPLAETDGLVTCDLRGRPSRYPITVATATIAKAPASETAIDDTQRGNHAGNALGISVVIWIANAVYKYSGIL